MGRFNFQLLSSIEDYREVLVENDKGIPFWYTILAKAFSWSLLTGYLIFPASFTSTKSLEALNKLGAAGRPVADVVSSLPPKVVPLVFASLICFLSLTVLVWLWTQKGGNCLWSLNNLFLYIRTF